MKKGHDIKEVVQKINNDVQYKKDYIVTLNALQINKSEKVFPNIQVTDSPTQYNLTEPESGLRTHRSMLTNQATTEGFLVFQFAHYLFAQFHD